MKNEELERLKTLIDLASEEEMVKAAEKDLVDKFFSTITRGIMNRGRVKQNTRKLVRSLVAYVAVMQSTLHVVADREEDREREEAEAAAKAAEAEPTKKKAPRKAAPKKPSAED